MKSNKLLIVSDTAIYNYHGENFGFGPVVREIEFIESNFDEIVWIGFNRKDKIGDLSMQKIQSRNVKIRLLNRVGGSGIVSLFTILLNYPIMFFVILKHVKKADIIHSRAPSHPALIAGLLSFFIRNKIWWHKYAGNWNQTNPPLSYGFQRRLLKKLKHTKVTINGFWEPLRTSPKERSIQPKHCISFENPCLTSENLQQGKETVSRKTFHPPFSFAFVGRLEDAKGVSRIIESLKEISSEKIERIHFVGNGNDIEKYKFESQFLGEKVVFHGFQNTEKVHQLLAESHFFLLPSSSEGFPKVIAEAACYGAVPVVSDVGSISHYVNESNGFLWPLDTKSSYTEVLLHAVQSSPALLAEKARNGSALAEKFTFDAYLEKLKKNILEPWERG